MKTKLGKLLTRKRTWATIISWTKAIGVPIACTIAPEYSVPIMYSSSALDGISGALSGKSAFDANKVGQDVAETVKGVKAVRGAKDADKPKRKTKKVAD